MKFRFLIDYVVKGSTKGEFDVSFQKGSEIELVACYSYMGESYGVVGVAMSEEELEIVEFDYTMSLANSSVSGIDIDKKHKLVNIPIEALNFAAKRI